MKEELVKLHKQYKEYLEDKFGCYTSKIERFDNFNDFICWLDRGYILD